MPLKIYYLDDEEQLTTMFKELFDQPEFAIETFNHPCEALQAIRRSPPDLLVLDYRLPKTTGDKLAQSVGIDIPKILVSGDLNISLQAEFLRVFPKPYDYDQMLEFLLSRLTLKAAG